MAQYELNLTDYWRIIRRRRWIIILSFIVVGGASIILSFRQKPYYEASSRVKIEQKRAMAGLLVDLVSWSTGDPMETQRQVITSRQIAEEAAKELKLVDENSPQEEFDAIVTRIKSSISTERMLRADIIKITATAGKPDEAIRIANTVTQVYIDESLREKINQSRTVREFIEQQLGVAEKDLTISEETFKRFKEEGTIGDLDKKKDLILKNLDQVEAELVKVKTEREKIEQLVEQLREGEKIGKLLQASSLLDNDPLFSALRKELTDLEFEHSSLSEYYTENHPKLLRIADKIDLVSGRIGGRLKSRMEVSKREESNLKRRRRQFKQELKLLPAKELEFDRLDRELRTNEGRYNNLKEKFDSASIAEAEKTSDVTWIDKAVSAVTIAKGGGTVAFAGGMIGLILGLVLAFVREGLDTSIGTIEDVESYLKIPVLGVIPHVEVEEERTGFLRRKPKMEEITRMRTRLVTQFDPKSPVAEAYRTLRTNIEFLGPKEKGKVLLLTSTGPQEGKTTVSANLAVTMAQEGKRTLLIGSDLRRPFIAKLFGIEREPGLTNILIGTIEWQKALRTVTDILMGTSEWEKALKVPGLDNLKILTAGYIPPNPSEILNSAEMASLLEELKKEFDVILLDSPPVLPVTDAAILSAKVDAAVMVYYVGRVARGALLRAKTQLDAAGANVCGIVLNDIKAQEMTMYPTYYYHYYRYYGEGAKRKRR